MENNQVSYYSTMFNPQIERGLVDIIDNIRHGAYASQIAALRSEIDDERRSELKKRLPAFTPSGIFLVKRQHNTISYYTRYVVLDFDKVPLAIMSEALRRINADPHTVVSFVSPSGNGIKVIVEVDSEKSLHISAFNLVKVYYESATNLPVDPSGKDISRLCFVSDDPNAYSNFDNHTIFHIAEAPSLLSHKMATRQPQDGLAGGVSTPSNGRAIAAPRGEPADSMRQTGEQQQQRRGRPRLSDFEKAVNATERKVGGYSQGTRNTFVFELACRLRFLGVAEEEAARLIAANYGDLGDGERRSSIKSAFGYKGSASAVVSGKKIASREKCKEIMAREFEVRWNQVLMITEIRATDDEVAKLMFLKPREWIEIDDYIVNSIYDYVATQGVAIDVREIRLILMSSFAVPYNPFIDYFDSLTREWEQQGGGSYIEDYLSRSIVVKNGEHFNYFFKKWVVAMYACAVNDEDVNHTVLVLTGDQGIGKTTWSLKFIPPELKRYMFSGYINPGDKDTMQHLSECMLINLDELENLNKTELSALKETITKSVIRVRKAYAHSNQSFVRRASFIGSVNHQQFLTDTTGNRRFLCFEVADIDLGARLDYARFWSDVRTLYDSGFNYWVTSDDFELLNSNNERFELRTVEEELFQSMYDIPEDGEMGAKWLTASEILVYITNRSRMALTATSRNNLGRVMKALGVYTKRTGGTTRYKVKEKNYHDPVLINSSDVSS